MESHQLHRPICPVCRRLRLLFSDGPRSGAGAVRPTSGAPEEGGAAAEEDAGAKGPRRRSACVLRSLCARRLRQRLATAVSQAAVFFAVQVRICGELPRQRHVLCVQGSAGGLPHCIPRHLPHSLPRRRRSGVPPVARAGRGARAVGARAPCWARPVLGASRARARGLGRRAAPVPGDGRTWPAPYRAVCVEQGGRCPPDVMVWVAMCVVRRTPRRTS